MILLRCARSACLACKCSTCSAPGECHGSLSAKWRVAGCSAGDCSKRCTPCGWLVLTKTAPCRVITAKAMMTWQIMTRGLAQAGNRTSKTALCSQWWDCKPEWSVDASGPGNQCDCQLYSIYHVIDCDELLFPHQWNQNMLFRCFFVCVCLCAYWNLHVCVRVCRGLSPSPHL